MERLFAELLNILTQQQQLVQQMNSAAQQQSEALRQNDTTALNNAVNQLQKLTMQMAQLDPKREQVQKKLAAELGLAADSTLTAMLPQAPARVKADLTTLQGELQQQLNKLQQTNEVNKVLTQRAMQVTAGVLKIFQGTGNQTYQPGGKTKSTDPVVQVLNKTV